MTRSAQVVGTEHRAGVEGVGGGEVTSMKTCATMCACVRARHSRYERRHLVGAEREDAVALSPRAIWIAHVAVPASAARSPM